MNNSCKAFHLEFHITKMLLFKNSNCTIAAIIVGFDTCQKERDEFSKNRIFLKLFPRDRKESWQVNISSVLHASLHLYKAARQGVLQEIFFAQPHLDQEVLICESMRRQFLLKTPKVSWHHWHGSYYTKGRPQPFSKVFFFNREQPTRIYKLCLI